MATVTTQLTGVEAEVLRADDGRFEAMRKGDWAGLDAALADDLIYVHSTARQESKAEHIANLRGGKPHYRGIAPRDRRGGGGGGGGGGHRRGGPAREGGGAGGSVPARLPAGAAQGPG